MSARTTTAPIVPARASALKASAQRASVQRASVHRAPVRRAARRDRGWVAAVRAVPTRLGADHLLRNSLFILLSTGTMGVCGFLFWTISARLFTPTQVGVASTLVTASTMVAYSSLLGFNQTFVRSLPTAEPAERNRLIDTGLLLVLATGTVLATLYILIVPLVVHELRPVRDSLAFAIFFVVLTGVASVNLATDAVFLAYRSAVYNFAVDGVVQGLVKLALPWAVVALGGFGIFASSGLAGAAATLCSVYLLVRRFGYRPRLRISPAVLREEFRFSSAAYGAHLLDMVPVLVVPLIVIRARGPHEAAYFFIAFQISTMFNALAYSMSQSMFVEGSYADGLRALALRSAKVQAWVIPAGSVLLAVMGPWILAIVGDDYRQNGWRALAILALSTPAVAVSAWTMSMLKLTGRLRGLVLASLVHAVGVGGLAEWWAPWGLDWVAGAWLAGTVLSALTGVACLSGARLLRRSEEE
jgi:O-antigen/teichoic acid export membrane protein